MKTSADGDSKFLTTRKRDNDGRVAGESVPQTLEDRRASVSTMQRVQHMADNSSRLARVQQQRDVVQRAARPEQRSAQKPNDTGLPDKLKSGIEALSGLSMDDVKVHYNSDKPAQLQAHAYAHGNEIHLGAGQERHLPHEAWHVVQQAQGRVKATVQMREGAAVNDDVALETEADVMGAKALQINGASASREPVSSKPSTAGNAPVQRLLNVEGIKYATLSSFKQSGVYATVFDWLKTEDGAIGKKGYDTTLGQYVSSEDVEKFHSVDHFKQNLLYDLRQGTWIKDSNASATLRFMTRRGWKNAANKKSTIVDDHAKQAISLYRTMPLAEAKAIMIDKDLSRLSGHMGDYAAALDYCHRATDHRVLVEFQLKPGAHKQLFSKEKLAVVAGGETTGHIRDRYETDDSKYSTATAGEGLHAEKIGAKSEVHGVAGFSLAAHGAVASGVLKPLIEAIRPLLNGKENAAPVKISKSDFVRAYSD